MAGCIGVLVAVAAGWVVHISPAEHTFSSLATGPAPPVPASPATIPDRLTEVWQAASSATYGPEVIAGVVVTGEGSSVVGRDPLDGRARWTYRRDLPLCVVGAGWRRVIAVYRRGQYCSEITSLASDSGRRGSQRNSDLPAGTRLLFDGPLLIAAGRNHLESWRSDLVKTLEYGAVRAPLEPHTQPRPDCRHTSVAAAGPVALLEQCPTEQSDRLTVLLADTIENPRPEVATSTLLPFTGARIIAVAGDRVALLVGPRARLSVRTLDEATEVASYPLEIPLTDLAPSSEQVGPTTDIPGAVLWWTGSHTIALADTDLHPLWSLPHTLGPGTRYAGHLVVPTPGALLVVDPRHGQVQRSIPVHRGRYQGPIAEAALGALLFEQRGPTTVALR